MTEFIVKHWLTVLFGFITTGFAAMLRHITVRLKKEREVSKAMQAGLMALLSARIIDMSYSYQEQGYCPVWAKANAEMLYKAYHVLGGNGSITDAYQRLMSLPMEGQHK